MNTSPSADHDRFLNLLADRALVGLDADQQLELEALLQANPDFDTDALDRTTAMLDLAVAAGDPEPLPQHLKHRALLQASSTRQPPESVRLSATAGRSKMRRREVVAWLAAAACLLLAMFAWSRWPQANRPPAPRQNPPVAAENGPSPTRPNDKETDPRSAEPTIAQLREQLLASAPDVLHLQLVSDNGGDVANESGGDIVWSGGRQIGYLRLRGLAGDDPAQRQYQLWIVGSDASGNDIINGGIFPVDRSTGELILPIQADQFVQQPKMFVVSVEPSGGGAALTAPLLAKSDGVGP